MRSVNEAFRRDLKPGDIRLTNQRDVALNAMSPVTMITRGNGNETAKVRVVAGAPNETPLFGAVRHRMIGPGASGVAGRRGGQQSGYGTHSIGIFQWSASKDQRPSRALSKAARSRNAVIAEMRSPFIVRNHA